MAVGVISDIHSNLEALKKTLVELDKIGVEDIWCLGDIVGYGANPNECTEIVRDRCSIVIAGNHDWAALNKTDITYFNPIAKEAIIWTRDEMRDDNSEYLNKLELKASIDDFFLVHSTPSNPDQWRYLFGRDDFGKEFDNFTEDICLIGHSHLPTVIDDKLRLHPLQIQRDKKSRYIMNIGSVGQPRDGDPRASFALIDGAKVEIIRVEYDVEKTKDKILKAGLPSFLGERLLVGR